MRIVLDRRYCDANLAFCQRCSAALIREPEGYERPCITDIVEDGRDILTIEMFTDGRVLKLELDDEMRDVAAIEGWEALADFDPALFRTGALERWRLLSQLPTVYVETTIET